MPIANFQNYDYDTEAEAIKRQQAMAEAVRANSMEQVAVPTAMGGNQVQAAINPMAIIAKMLQGAVANKEQQAVEKRRKELSQRYSDDLASGMDRYEKTVSGEPAITLPADQAGPVRDATAGNPRQAIMDAIASNHPVLKQFAMQQLMEQGKGALTPEKLASMATPESVLANRNNPAAWQPKRELKAAAPGEVFFDEGGNIAQPGNGGVKQNADGALSGNGWQTMEIGGDKYQVTSTGLKKLDNATKISMNPQFSVVNAGQKAGSAEYFKGAAKTVEALGTAAQSSQELLNTLGTLKELHTAGINSNVTSDMATAAQNLAQKLGVKVDANRLANTETYNSLVTDLWQRSVAQYGGNRGVTATEAEAIKKLTPLASTSPQAREQLFAIQETAAKRSIAKYKQANRSFAKAATADDPSMFEIPDDIAGSYVPSAGGSPNPAVTESAGKPTVSNW